MLIRGNASGLGAAGSDVRAEFAGDVGGGQQGLPCLSQGVPLVEPGVRVPAVLPVMLPALREHNLLAFSRRYDLRGRG